MIGSGSHHSAQFWVISLFWRKRSCNRCSHSVDNRQICRFTQDEALQEHTQKKEQHSLEHTRKTNEQRAHHDAAIARSSSENISFSLLVFCRSSFRFPLSLSLPSHFIFLPSVAPRLLSLPLLALLFAFLHHTKGYNNPLGLTAFFTCRTSLWRGQPRSRAPKHPLPGPPPSLPRSCASGCPSLTHRSSLPSPWQHQGSSRGTRVCRACRHHQNRTRSQRWSSKVSLFRSLPGSSRTSPLVPRRLLRQSPCCP